MLFNSYEFIFIFLPVVFAGYFYLNKRKLIVGSKVWLIFSSLFFYGWWNVDYLPLLILSIVINFTFSSLLIQMEKTEAERPLTRRQVMLLGIVWNIIFLSYFKYMNFFIDNANQLLGVEFDMVHVALPLAISFFTIQQIAYLVDAYEGISKEKSFLNYILFVTFFPQLIVGPIVHHKEMMPQFLSLKSKLLNYENIAAGLFIFSIGLFKKVVLADTFAFWADHGYAHAADLTLLEAWATSLSYTFQLYFDFSGYSDMAIGVAMLFNIKLPQNFDSPLKATNIVDFWQRWHMTLTGFITTYIYTAWVRSLKKITFEKMMMLTVFAMIIVGLWHGASWAWILFGLAHGLAIVLYHYWKKLRFHIPAVFAWLMTFVFINISLVFVKVDNSNSLESSLNILNAMFGMNGIALPSFALPYIPVWLGKAEIIFGGVATNIGGGLDTFMWLTAGLALILLFQNSNQMTSRLGYSWKTVSFTSIILLYSVFSIEKHSTFLYFNF